MKVKNLVVSVPPSSGGDSVTSVGDALSGNNGASSRKTTFVVPQCPQAHRYHLLVSSIYCDLPEAALFSSTTLALLASQLEKPRGMVC